MILANRNVDNIVCAESRMSLWAAAYGLPGHTRRGLREILIPQAQCAENISMLKDTIETFKA